MNIAMVAMGHRSNPFDLEGSMSVHFNAADLSSRGAGSASSARGFNLVVNLGAKKDSTFHFILEREADGLRFERTFECTPMQRNYQAFTGQFASADRYEPVGRIDAVLQWDGTQGVFSGSWVVPRHQPDVVRHSAVESTSSHELSVHE
jgi:hypothetical protein